METTLPEEATERLFTLQEMEQAVAQAEEEAYRRGRNESIDQLMAKPSPLENPVKPSEPSLPADEFLSFIRPSIWD